MTAVVLQLPSLWPDAQLVLPATASREEWLAAREHGIGGSETAAIKRDHEYESEYRVWESKTGRAEEKDQTDSMLKGRIFEAAIAQFYAETSGVEIIGGPGLLRSKKFPHMLATPDRLIPAQRRGLELKNVTSFGVKRKLLDGEMPAYWWWQMVTYIAVTGLDGWVLAADIPGRVDPFIKVVDRSEVQATIDALGPYVEEWWGRHVELDIPPEYGRPSTEQAPLQLGDVVEAWVPDAALADKARLKQINNQIDMLEAESSEIRDRYLTEMGAHKYLVADGRRIFQRVVRPNGRFDRKGLKKKYPEIEAEFSAPGQPTSFIRLCDEQEL